MRVFVAGATGVVGRRLVDQLVARGHQVVGTHHGAGRGDELRRRGATPVRLDLVDAGAVRSAVREAAPDVVVHEATALAGSGFGRNLDKTFAATNDLRVAGTDALLAAASDAGVTRVVAQSFASLRYARVGGWVKNEDAELDPDPVASTRQTNAAMRHLDEAVRAAGGIVLRYGGFYGEPDDGMVGPVRKRQFPVVGDGAGVTSFVQLDDAASATVLAIENGRPGVYHVVDDEPAAMRDWLPVLAEALGAKSPRHVPTWIARVVAGDAAVMMATQARGASNAKIKRELGWSPRYPTWRQGFPAVYSAR